MQSRGITLLELLVSIAVMGIMAATAIPSFNNFIKDSRLSSSLINLRSDLYLTRSNAIRYNRHTVICASNEANTNCSGSPDWENGWIVFVDINKDGECKSADGICEDGGKIVKIGEGVTSTDLKLRGYSHRSYKIRYDPEGFSYAFNGTITACDSRGTKKARGLVINNTGRVRSTDKDDKLKCE
ncbi:MAG: prepilin-type N-terminal cleavage/methylation domain-containing protein [Gammaproteobacteria bacterium]|nr:MAG: prepilin-type N-terminal cleavage/methylation domain-containing protein [Gammaproteobacteria bacterium]